MFVLMISRSSLKLGHLESRTRSLSNICSTKVFVIKLKFFYTHIVIENYDCRYKGSMDSSKGCPDTLGMCLAFD